ncbi:MAG: DUF3109 family protein [Bacteroidia bacterium]|nr:DUF3109 family protein [Bacteroidia bacterium]
MVLIDNVLIHEAIFRVEFACRLEQCKGACCVAGDSGAPVEQSEIAEIKQWLSIIWDYLSEESRLAILDQDVAVYDSDGDLGTPLVKGQACAYAFFEGGIAYCSFERAYFAGKIPFRKPISCHLYPIRLEQGQFVSMKYHKWDICQSACSPENKEKIIVFQYVKDAIIRKFGEEFYTQLEEVFSYLKHKT